MKPIKKFFSPRKLKIEIEKLKKKNKRIVFTNGCFDIIHSGHVLCLEKAKASGDILVVAINSDQSVSKLKGKKHPIFSLKERMRVLNAFECVNYLTVFNDLTPLKLIKAFKPDVLVKGSDYLSKEIIGSQFVQSYGGKVKRIPIYKNYSSRRIIKKLSALF